MAALKMIGMGLMAAVALLTSASGEAQVRNGEPAVSPDGARIAFLSTRPGSTILSVIWADGSAERDIAQVPDGAHAGWTADGRIWFSIPVGQSSELYEIDPTGANRHLLAALPGRGQRLSSDRRHVINIGGTYTQTRLAVSGLDGTEPRELSDGLTPAWTPQWSPDGRQIAFATRDGPASSLKVVVVNADGTGRRDVTQLLAGAGNAQWPAWSPDGGRLAIQVNQSMGGNAQIWIVDLATLEAHPVAPHDRPYLDEAPSWFPDGRRIAIQSDRSGQMHIWVLNLDGSEPRQLTR